MIPLPEKYWEANGEHLKLGVPWITPGSYEWLYGFLEKTKIDICYEFGIGGSTKFFFNQGIEYIGYDHDNAFIEVLYREIPETRVHLHNFATQEEAIEYIDWAGNRSEPGQKSIISIDSTDGFNRDAFLQLFMLYFGEDAIFILDNYACPELWPDHKGDKAALSSLFETHEILDFDDPHWRGKGTRIVCPKGLLA